LSAGSKVAVGIEAAPAKVNLHLHVVGKLPNGYHLLDSLVVFAGVGDRVGVGPAEDLSLRLTGPFAGGLEAEGDNLVLQAARRLADWAGIRPYGALALEKNLPVSSGIGGGSADAAAALRLLCRFWSVAPGDAVLRGIGQDLGADIPVCLGCEPVVMSGIGEVLAPVERLPSIGVMLVNPGVAVPTKDVFRLRDGEFSAPLGVPLGGWASVSAMVETLLAGKNDLEGPALRLAPVVGDVLTGLRAAPDCLLARMSGSGATCFGLFPSPAEAIAAADGLRRPGWWVWAGGLFDPERF
jgi:4-diphosphocytidyl-2-C-methyl-D-erythritol kinase